MIAVVQRSGRSSVEVDGEIVGAIDGGLVVLVGVFADDSPADAIKLAEKVYGLRIFEDDAGKMNLSVADVGGKILAISQFTLCADTTRGRRPSFDKAMEPENARKLFQTFVEVLRGKGIEVSTGVFGAKMLVRIENVGPVTIIIDSRAKRKR